MLERKPDKAKDHNCEQGEAFHRDGLRHLRTGSLEEIDGRLIVHLMHSEASDEVETFARNWIQKFPEHECVPLVVGHWLQIYGDDEAIELAERYIKSATPQQLGPLIIGLATISPAPAALW